MKRYHAQHDLPDSYSKMRAFLLLFASLISACGVETATTAAGAGASKAAEAEAARETLENVEAQVQRAAETAVTNRPAGDAAH